MLREFILPDWKKLIIYLVFVILFMGETLLLRSVYLKDYVVSFLLGVYKNFFSEMNYVNFFAVSFIYYLLVLFALYILSCFVMLILKNIKK
jgi:hypothetical protein